MFQCFSRTWTFLEEEHFDDLYAGHQDMVHFIQVLYFYIFSSFWSCSFYGVLLWESLQYKEHAGLKASFRRQNIWVLASLYIRAEPYTVKFPLLLPPWCKACWAINTGVTVTANHWLFWIRFEFKDPAPLSIRARVWITPSFKNRITIIQYMFDN